MKKKQSHQIKNITIWSLFLIFTITLIINILKLTNVETPLRILLILILIITFLIITIYQKKKRTLMQIIMLILSIIYLFLNYNFHQIYNSLNNLSNNVVQTTLCLVTTQQDSQKLQELSQENIGIISSKIDKYSYKLAQKILTTQTPNNNLIEYNNYDDIIQDLEKGTINYAFLPKEYSSLINNTETTQPTLSNLQIIYQESQTTKINSSTSNTQNPFSILLIGVDELTGAYNADTLILITFNPQTLKTTMLSIPRDTYTEIACTQTKNKINSSGRYGDSCVIATISNYLDIEIDYYIKINFTGIVELVNQLNGIEVEVPYAFCEQNSHREFGNQMIYVDAGLQTLNGEQALALARNRHYWKEYCPSKYTEDGIRNDITRGQNQQLVIKSLINKIMTINSFNQFYSLLDTISNNMTTNMTKETILSFYNIGKKILKQSSTTNFEDILNLQKLSLENYSTYIAINNQNLSVIINYEESVEYVSNQMSQNLNFSKENSIKTISFDINTPYPTEPEYQTLTTNVNLLPNFIGQTVTQVKKYCQKWGLNYQIISTTNSQIITSQNIMANTDLASLQNKTLILQTKESDN